MSKTNVKSEKGSKNISATVSIISGGIAGGVEGVK
jgi:hypothetical protein